MGALAPLQPQLLIPPICKVPEKQHVYGTYLILSMTVACLFNALREKTVSAYSTGACSPRRFIISATFITKQKLYAAPNAQ